MQATSNSIGDNTVQVFHGEWDEEGVYVYQAFNDPIANYALENQRFGGPDFNPTRMTWFKPSFAWMLYRAGYGHKPNQTRILKIKLSHEDLAYILDRCTCTVHGEKGKTLSGEGRVQWDPSRDLYSAEGGVPKRLPGLRAIQIGVMRSLSEFYSSKPLSIVDVTELANKVGKVHGELSPRVCKTEMLALELPLERPYIPRCRQDVLVKLGMMAGETANAIAQIGKPSQTTHAAS